MAKKNKKKLSYIIAKKQEIQKASSTSSEPSHAPTTKTIETGVDKNSPEADITDIVEANFTKDVKRTAINTLIIVLILAIAFVVDKKTNYLQNMGDWLYTTLKLNS